MSEYQYYEFLAVDTPLSEADQQQVRATSTRAHITSSGFINEYHWGGFHGRPLEMMKKFYDVHVYVTNWGTHQLMLRIPKSALPRPGEGDGFVDEMFSLEKAGKNVVLDITSDAEGEDFTVPAESWMGRLTPLRQEIVAGDRRPFYLAWLGAVGQWERSWGVTESPMRDRVEPAVPPGLANLTAAQQALVEFLRIDRSLMAAAAQTSAATRPSRQKGALRDHIAALPEATKNTLLRAVADGAGGRVQSELLAAVAPAPAPTCERRTVATIVDAAYSTSR